MWVNHLAGIYQLAAISGEQLLLHIGLLLRGERTRSVLWVRRLRELLDCLISLRMRRLSWVGSCCRILTLYMVGNLLTGSA